MGGLQGPGHGHRLVTEAAAANGRLRGSVVRTSWLECFEAVVAGMEWDMAIGR